MSSSDNNNKRPNNMPPLGEDPNKKKSKFNIYWIYGIVGACFFLFVFAIGSGASDSTLHATLMS